jgi:hypothetical protein
MNVADRLPPRVRSIRLNRSLLNIQGLERVAKELRSIIRSVRFEILEPEGILHLLGPDTRYHQIDPHLPKALGLLRENMSVSDILSYKIRTPCFDLYLEDSWSGYFISEEFGKKSSTDDLIVIHLDDHMDMMPTLLAVSGQTMTNPTTGEVFDPTDVRSWETAIHAGCVSIGNFITPLYYSGQPVHVRHINNAGGQESWDVVRSGCRYELIPDIEFAALGRSKDNGDKIVGTYVGGSSAENVLRDIPSGHVVVHIDLDYFINDFNGNATTRYHCNDRKLQREADGKIKAFFEALRVHSVRVHRWMVATSPGFCSGFHWDRLLTQIREGIDRVKIVSAF